MSQPIQVPVLISGLSTKVDGSIKIVMETRELGGADAAKLFDLRNSEAWALLQPKEFADEDMKQIPKDSPDAGLGSKSPSKRLRDRMFVFYTSVVHGDPVEFDMWYARELDRLGQKYLEKIDNDQ